MPIAFAYVGAHYLTFLVFNGQSIVFLASDPLGDGSNLFGTADSEIDYSVLGSTMTWYLQVAFVVGGHVAALTLAHDRALALYDQARLGRTLPVLDAGGDGRLHELGAVPAVAIERLNRCSS